jgi:hypothetical protein
MDRLTCRLNNQAGEPTDTIIMDYHYAYLNKEKQFDLLIHRVNAYEDTESTPEEIMSAADRRHNCKIDCLLEKHNEVLEERNKMRERLEISPQGDDKIDELEESIGNLRFQLESVSTERDTLIKALKLSIETHSVDQKQVERLTRYYIQQAQEQEGNHDK